MCGTIEKRLFLDNFYFNELNVNNSTNKITGKMIRSATKHQYQHQQITTVKAVTVRNAEKERLGRERVQSFKEYIRSFGKTKYTETHIRRKHLLCFLTILQIPLFYIITLYNLVLVFGAALTLGMYVVMVILFGLPIYLLPLLLGSYSRKGYFSVWKCIPLLKGMGYTVMFMIMIPEIFSVASSGMSLLYIYDMFGNKIPWVDCDFVGATNTCIPMTSNGIDYPTVNCTRRLKRNDRPTFSAQNYFRFNKENEYFLVYPNKLGPVKPDWAIASLVTWALIFIFAMKGFKGFQRLMTNLHIFTGLCMVIFFIITLTLPSDYSSKSTFYSGLDALMSISFWTHIFLHVCERDEPGCSIYLSTFMTSNTKINVDAMIVYSLKVLIFSLAILWTPILIQNIFTNYKSLNVTCFTLSAKEPPLERSKTFFNTAYNSSFLIGTEIIFAVVPDILARLSFPQAWIILWFVCIYIHSFGSALYTITATIESLINNFPLLSIYRIHMCTLLCVVGASVNMLFCTRLSRDLMIAWQQYGSVILRIVVMTIFIFSIMFIYTIPELCNDFQFFHGFPLAKFWVNSWKICPFLILCEMIFLVIKHLYNVNPTVASAKLVSVSYIIAVLMLLPIIGVMIWKYCVHVKYQMVSSVIQPEPGWGYYNLRKRLDRKRFNPKREIRYKTSKLHCNHQCLASHPKKIKKMLQAYNVRKGSWIAQLEEP